MAIVSKLKEIIKEKGILQEDLAREIGISVTNLSRIYSGKIRASRFSTGDALCRALSCQYGDIFVYVPDDKVTEDDVVCYFSNEDDEGAEDGS